MNPFLQRFNNHLSGSISLIMVNDGLRQRPAKEGSVVSPIAASTEGQASKRFEPTPEARRADLAADTHHAYEFGGPFGVTAMMLGFPCLMCMYCLNLYERVQAELNGFDYLCPFSPGLTACFFDVPECRLPLDLSVVLSGNLRSTFLYRRHPPLP